MRIVFHADASPDMGSGHVMRTSVLAEEAINRGIPSVFVGNIQDLGWVSQRIQTLGFDSILKDFDNLRLDPSQDLLILDSYTLDVDFQAIQKEKWLGVISISDEVTPPFRAHLKIIPSLVEKNPESDGVKILSGAKYILTRRAIKKKSREVSASIGNRLLVVGGGSDPFGFCKKMANLLDLITCPLEVHFFSGEEFESTGIHNFIVHAFGNELDDIANECDFILTTASTSSLEFIAREIPTAVVCVIDNQREYYNQLGVLGLAVQIGLRNEDQSWEIDLNALNKFLRDNEIRTQLCERMSDFIDLNGASRVLDQILEAFHTKQI